jgi:hypothetical protein
MLLVIFLSLNYGGEGAVGLGCWAPVMVLLYDSSCNSSRRPRALSTTEQAAAEAGCDPGALDRRPAFHASGRRARRQDRLCAALRSPGGFDMVAAIALFSFLPLSRLDAGEARA